MFSLQLACLSEEAEAVAAELWDFGTVAISESELGDRVTLLAGFDTDRMRSNLLQRFAQYEPHWEQDETDWEAETRSAWSARETGSRLFLAPIWCEDKTPTGRVRLIHNPGAASGTGEHPCTQLGLAALEGVVNSGSRVVDVGTGSGILAIAAVLLGATSSLAIDTDENCLSTARENFGLNGLTPWLIAGSAGCICGGYGDVTIANISGTVLLSILDELLAVTKPGGILILTGFTESEAAFFQVMFPEAVLSGCNEWRCLTISLSSSA